MGVLIILSVVLLLIICHSFDSASYNERLRNNYPTHKEVKVKKIGKKKRIITINNKNEA